MLPPERAGRSAPSDLAARREGLAQAAASGLWQTDPAPDIWKANGVRCLVFRPAASSRGTLLHFHGGAFRIGSPVQVGPFAAKLARETDMTVVCPTYRLAPEHPFPAALHDGAHVLNALQDETLMISGDSAGGAIAAAVTGMAVAANRPVAGLISLSAWLDLTVESASYQSNAATDPLFSAQSALEAADTYLQGGDPRDALASPLFGDLRDYPRTFVSVGEGEVLADDARRFHAALEAAGTDARLSIVPNMEHVAVVRDLALPGAAETFAAVTAFVKECVGAPVA